MRNVGYVGSTIVLVSYVAYPPIQIFQYVRTKSSTNDFSFLHFDKPVQKSNRKKVVIIHKSVVEVA